MKLRLSFLSALIQVIALFFVSNGTCEAKARHKVRVLSASKPAYAAIVIDAQSGKILHADGAHELRRPASLTKMMTLYITYERIKAKQLRWTDRVFMTAHAAAQAPTKLGLPVGQSISVHDAVLALIVGSCNDVAEALATKLSGGNPTEFARMMTRKAKQLGMEHTTFYNASGLPHRFQLTTAHDLAKLSLAHIHHFPQYYNLFSTPTVHLHGRRMTNHNKLLGVVFGRDSTQRIQVDGLKTGYTRLSGFNLATSAAHGGKRIIVVVMGGKTALERNIHVKLLIKKAFQQDGLSSLVPASHGKPSQSMQQPLKGDRGDRAWMIDIGYFEKQKLAQLQFAQYKKIEAIRKCGKLSLVPARNQKASGYSIVIQDLSFGQAKKLSQTLRQRKIHHRLRPLQNV